MLTWEIPRPFAEILSVSTFGGGLRRSERWPVFRRMSARADRDARMLRRFDSVEIRSEGRDQKDQASKGNPSIRRAIPTGAAVACDP